MSLPSSPEAKRIAAIMHRRLTTHWNPREIKEFRLRNKEHCFGNQDDLANLERYYAKHWPPESTKNILRHDLITFLRHFQGEVDRANAWAERHPVKPPPRKIIPLPPIKSEPFVASTDPEEIRRVAAFQAELAERKKRREG